MPTKVRLTQGYVNKLTAPTATGKPQMIYDTQTPGFAILLSGKTNRRSYVAAFGTRFQQRAIEDVSLIMVVASAVPASYGAANEEPLIFCLVTTIADELPPARSRNRTRDLQGS